MMMRALPLGILLIWPTTTYAAAGERSPRPHASARAEADDALTLLVDDEEPSGKVVARWLQWAGYQVNVRSRASMGEAVSRRLPEAVGGRSIDPATLRRGSTPSVATQYRKVPVIVMNGGKDPDTVASAIEHGSYDYVAKPLDRTSLLDELRHAVEHGRPQPGSGSSPARARTERFCGITGSSEVMKDLFRQIERVAASDITVLIQGESGSGKELVARAIHQHSARHGGPLVAVNCAAVPRTLQDSEFFGHEKGAFTGADQARAGRFEQADGGTLFLDEVAELSLELQAKLLRVLQERQFERVGGRKARTSNFRLIAATHRNLEEMVERGEFRLDLFHRLAVVELSVPALNERAGDVALLTASFLDALSEQMGVARPVLDPSTLTLLERYRWPGNVRELHNTLQRALVVCEGGRILPRDLSPRVRKAVERPAPSTPPRVATSVAPALGSTRLADIERAAIEAAIAETDGNLSEVTRRLGIGRATLYRRLKKYGLR